MSLPTFMYGTAWKEERTEALTAQALAAGFRAIDTANQRKHYFEAGVGAAVKTSGIPRGELFLQTKFTYLDGQDRRLPYDPIADISTQVHQSFASSLEHLGVDYLDSLVLHGPASSYGWSDEDREAWGAMESLHRDKRTRHLGVSNVSVEQLAALCKEAKVQPTFVQNRCYARTSWDRQVRAFSKDHGITYQGFSLLTANRREITSPPVTAIAERLGATIPQVIFAFVRTAGMLPLTGSSSPAHLKEDLASLSLVLTDRDVATIEMIASHR